MAKDTKNDFNEKIPEPLEVERTPEKTLGEAKAHEIRPEERGLPGPSESRKMTKPALLLAEFDTPAACMHGAEKLRDAGYTIFDAHTPFPVHGMDKAMGLRDSRLGWIVLCCGMSGTFLAWLMMFWMNGVDYPIVIGGKPPGTLPSMIPIMFEVTVLFSALSAVFGMLGINKLPRHHHPLFYSERFKGFSDDKFFLSVEAEDPKFDTTRTRALLESAKATFVELVNEEEEAAPGASHGHAHAHHGSH
jgi:hypothetical protein